MSSKAKKALGVLGVLVVLGGVGIYGAFSASVSSTGNQFSTTDSAISADGGGDGVATQPVYFKNNAVPGDNGNNGTECVEIENTGGAPGTSFKLYGTTTGTPTPALVNALELTIERGTGSDKDCGDFVSAATVYDGSLAAFQSGHTSFANGITLPALASGATQSFRYFIELPAATNPAGLENANAGNQTFTWEIQSS